MNRHTLQELQELQALPLEIKIRLTQQRIREWINHFGESGVYVSFSGGKDSTVLLDIVRKQYPNVKAMFVDIPTQYPELRDFVKTYGNVDIVYPKIGFVEVCEKYGFPLISKEVSECVQGARKYLTSILNERASLTDRQTDLIAIGTREFKESGSTRKFNHQWQRLMRQGKYAESPRGGYDRKYRRIRGIGEFTQRTNGESKRGQQSTAGNNVGNVHKRQETTDKGEYP